MDYTTHLDRKIYMWSIQAMQAMVSLSCLKTIEVAPTTTVNTSGTGYAVATLVANLEATTATLGGSDIISTDNTKTLTNKTINASNNTISNITSSMFSSAVTLQILNDSGKTAVKTIIGNAS